MRERADFSVQEGGGRTTIVVEGPLLVSTVAALDRELRAFDGYVQEVDISGAAPVDTVGAWTIFRFAQEHDAQISGASEQADVLLAAVEDSASSADVVSPRGTRFSQEIGRAHV